MIYVSSSCVRFDRIAESVAHLANNGFKNIELSGGTNYYPEFEDDLLELKEKYNLSYLIHNYFPPPDTHFVLNLASLNDRIFNNSIEHYLRAIELAKKIGSDKYGLHAGYFVDPSVKELGKRFKNTPILDKEKAIEKFCYGFKILKKEADQVKLYIENNVISASNFETYRENILMLTNGDEFSKLKESLGFNLLLDLAHLKVSSQTLDLDFEKEFSTLWAATNYIHLSDNDGLHDSNQTLTINSETYSLLKNNNLAGKTFSLEIYSGIEDLKEAYQLLNNLL